MGKRRRAAITVELLDEEPRPPPSQRSSAASSASKISSSEALSADPVARLVDAVYRDVDSYGIAKAGRRELEETLGTKLSSLTYGEISVGPFVQLLRCPLTPSARSPPCLQPSPALLPSTQRVGAPRTLPEPEQPPHFIDIGSGTGKAVLAAALLRPLSSACGVELVPKLHQVALTAEQTLRTLLAGQGAAAGAGATTTAGLGSGDELAAARQALAALGPSGLRLCCGDSFRGANSDALPEWVLRLCPPPPERPAGIAWLYAPCACFDPEMMASLRGWCERLLPGSVVITTTQKLPAKPKRKKQKHKQRGSGAGGGGGARCRMVLASSTSLSYAKGRLTFHVYHAVALARPA